MRRIGRDPALEARGHVVLDVRDEAAFAAGHLAGSGNLPRAAFRERRAELPPREQPLLLVAAEPGEAEAAAVELEALGCPDVAWLDAPLASLQGGHADRSPAARLWRPAPFLEEVLPRLPRGLAADLAAGSGREAVFLALNGFEVEAWDRAPEALERAAALARRNGASIRTVVADLERRDLALPAGRYRLVTLFRFLHRPLFPIVERALEPGGWLVYETYRVGQERFGRPRSRKFLLEPGELSSAFPTLTVVRHEEPTPAGGPLTARLLAFKPASGGRS